MDGSCSSCSSMRSMAVRLPLLKSAFDLWCSACSMGQNLLFLLVLGERREIGVAIDSWREEEGGVWSECGGSGSGGAGFCFFFLEKQPNIIKL